VPAIWVPAGQAGIGTVGLEPLERLYPLACNPSSRLLPASRPRRSERPRMGFPRLPVPVSQTDSQLPSRRPLNQDATSRIRSRLRLPSAPGEALRFARHGAGPARGSGPRRGCRSPCPMWSFHRMGRRGWTAVESDMEITWLGLSLTARFVHTELCYAPAQAALKTTDGSACAFAIVHVRIV
jgi:hypothetical protein